MAEEIGQQCRQYVADNAAAYDDQPEDEAVMAVVQGLRRRLEGLGWNPLDYQVDLEEIARDGLRLHRRLE